jgi:hypothetical protein
VWLQRVPGAWQPRDPNLGSLWHDLRIAVLAAAWSRRWRRAAGGPQFTPGDVAVAATDDLHTIARTDWARASTDSLQLDGVSPRVLNPRRHGASGPASVAQFKLRWCGGARRRRLRRPPPGPPPGHGVPPRAALGGHITSCPHSPTFPPHSASTPFPPRPWDPHTQATRTNAWAAGHGRAVSLESPARRRGPSGLARARRCLRGLTPCPVALPPICTRPFLITLSLYTLGKARPIRAKRGVKVIVRECAG